jgi:FdhD protein
MECPQSPVGVRSVSVCCVAGDVAVEKQDCLAVEEPLAIQIRFGPTRDRKRETVSVTMRTPGHDAELAVGLLFAEGIVSSREQVLRIEAGREPNAVRVELHPDVPVDLGPMNRRGFTTSSCGLCGKTSIDAVEVVCDGPRVGGPRVPAAIIHPLAAALRAAQPAFARTGGLHAAGLFDYTGNLLAVREDVGRHNAVDKLIGSALVAGAVPLHERIMMVSGRAGFELIQKAAVAGVPVFAAVGAPSSLAVELADRLGVTLLGFVRDGRFNIYTGAERIAL